MDRNLWERVGCNFNSEIEINKYTNFLLWLSYNHVISMRDVNSEKCFWFGKKKLRLELTAWKTFLFFSWSSCYKTFAEWWEHKSDYAWGQWEQDNCMDLVPIHYAQCHKSPNCHNLSFLESPSCLKYSTIAMYGRATLYCVCLVLSK